LRPTSLELPRDHQQQKHHATNGGGILPELGSRLFRRVGQGTPSRHKNRAGPGRRGGGVVHGGWPLLFFCDGGPANPDGTPGRRASCSPRPGRNNPSSTRSSADNIRPLIRYPDTAGAIYQPPAINVIATAGLGGLTAVRYPHRSGSGPMDVPMGPAARTAGGLRGFGPNQCFVGRQPRLIGPGAI